MVQYRLPHLLGILAKEKLCTFIPNYACKGDCLAALSIYGPASVATFDSLSNLLRIAITDPQAQF